MKKTFLRKISLILLFTLLISNFLISPAFAQGTNFKEVIAEGNKLSKDNIQSKESRGSSKNGKITATSLDNHPVPEINVKAANLLPLNGYFEQTVDVGSDTRKVKVYIPEGAPIRAFFTVITVPEGWDTEKFLHTSGWLKIADERQEGLYILEPGKDGWGSFEDELKYVYAAMQKFTDTTYYSTMGEHYFAGYGKGGAALQGWAVDNPLFVISQAYIHSEDLSANYLNETGTKEYGDEIDREGYPNVPYNEVPVPTWIINKNLDLVTNTVNYWKTANDVEAKSKKENGPFNRKVYTQKKTSKAWSTQYSGPISKVATLEQGIGETSQSLTKSIYNFLSYYTRYDNTSVYGNGLGIRGSYDVHTIEMTEPNGEKWIREYITYLPTSYDKNKKYPVVYAFGGGSQTGRVFFEASQWWQVAEENDFILVLPSSQYRSATSVTWNYNNTSTDSTANDFKFIEAVINEVDDKYSTDPSRRYATGQSQGSIMTQRMSFYLPNYFASLGSTSAPVFSEEEDGYDGIIPLYMIFGEKDIDAYDFTNKENKTYTAVDYWTTRNKLSGVMEWSDYSKEGRYHTYNWKNADGIPLFRYGWTEARKHNNLHAESKLLWEDWFSHWTMDENNVRYYNAKAVNTNVGGNEQGR